MLFLSTSFRLMRTSLHGSRFFPTHATTGESSFIPSVSSFASFLPFLTRKIVWQRRREVGGCSQDPLLGRTGAHGVAPCPANRVRVSGARDPAVRPNPSHPPLWGPAPRRALGSFFLGGGLWFWVFFLLYPTLWVKSQVQKRGETINRHDLSWQSRGAPRVL